MRPVDRGPVPQEETGRPRQFRPYQNAKADLLERLGGYCSYCERPGNLHVEHVIPKDHRTDLEEAWTNFLLACVNCNSTKGARNISRDGYLWPDEDNTWAVFEYFRDGIVRVADSLSAHERARARRLSELVGLERRPGRDLRARDLRWRKRREAWRVAWDARQRYQEDPDIADLVIILAKAYGFWSVWMTVFAGHSEVCDCLQQVFPGTAIRE